MWYLLLDLGLHIKPVCTALLVKWQHFHGFTFIYVSAHDHQCRGLFEINLLLCLL